MANVNRSAFAGGDQSYLRTTQYGDGSKLGVRFALHEQFSTATRSFRDFEAGLIDWPAEAEVLDCGTGGGRFWEADQIPRSVSLTVTDLSAGMVADSTAFATSVGYGNVAGQTCDVQSLSFEDASFDIVVANHMMYHVPDPDQGVRELARVLRPNGVALIATNGHGHMQEMKDAVDATFGVTRDGIYDVFGIGSGAERLGPVFKDVQWNSYGARLVVTDLAAAVAYGLSYPPGETASSSQAEAFAEEIQRRSVDGIFTINTRTGVFVCRGAR